MLSAKKKWSQIRLQANGLSSGQLSPAREAGARRH